MANSYEVIQQEIVSALTGRPAGTQIQPENHQQFALDLLDYIRSVEIIGASSLQGNANTNTVPIQPENAKVSYLSSVPPGQTYVYTNFLDENGEPISVTSTANTVSLITLLWNCSFWSVTVVVVQLAIDYSNGYLFMGMADPTTNPGTPDQKVFYLATEAGVYANFDDAVVSDETVLLFYDNNSWRQERTGIPVLDQIITESGNLWTITRRNGYLNASGVMTSSSNFNSCQITMTPGGMYRVVQQRTTSAGNYVRIFRYENETYTQIWSKQTNGVDVYCSCPNDGNTYVLQAIWDLRAGVTGETQVYERVLLKEVVSELVQTVQNLSLQVQDLTNNFPEVRQRINDLYPSFKRTANLANITRVGGYMNSSGHFVEDETFMQSLVKLENGATYYAHQNRTTNYFRVFSLSDGVYTQLTYSQHLTDWAYTVPAAGDIYMQLVVKLPDYSIKDIWLSKDQALTEWVAPFHLIELDPINEKIQQNATNIAENTSEIITINSEIHSPNLWQVTQQNGFYNASGVWTENTSYDSCQVYDVINGDTYRVKMQVVSSGGGNYVRVYRVENGTLTQVYYKQQIGGNIDYIIPNDGNSYMLQTVVRKTSGDGPAPEIHNISQDLILNVGKMANKLSDYRTIKILAIGNSYSRDAFMYFPFVLESMMPQVDITFGILYKGGCTLEEHYDYISNDTNYEAFDYYRTDAQRWETVSSKNVDYALGFAQWDIILLQQRSYKSNDYTTYQPYLNDIITLLQGKLTHNVKIGWFLTPALNDESPQLQEDTSDEMFMHIVEAVERLMNETAVEFVIPCGTAVQNARTTSLKNLGNSGGMMYDNLHLQEGIPCLVEAYVAAIVIANIMGKPISVFGNQIRPTAEWLTAHHIIQQHGSPVGVNDANCYIAQKCAAIAVKKPYVITNLTELHIV